MKYTHVIAVGNTNETATAVQSARVNNRGLAVSILWPNELVAAIFYRALPPSKSGARSIAKVPHRASITSRLPQEGWLGHHRKAMVVAQQNTAALTSRSPP
jgi:hypothetical protein